MARLPRDAFPAGICLVSDLNWQQALPYVIWNRTPTDEDRLIASFPVGAMEKPRQSFIFSAHALHVTPQKVGLL